MDYRQLIKQMTLEEKASLTSGKDFWQTVNIDRLGIPSMFLADGPTGIRKQAAAADHLGLNESIKATCFPTSAAVANSWSIRAAEELAACLGKEAVAQNVNVVLGPGLNIKRNPLCGRNFEYFSEDPYLAGKLAAAYVRGIQSSGVAACLKHFAANNQEYQRHVSDSVVDERTLREIYLTAFEIAVKEGGAKTVMSAYNKLNGIYANEHNYLLRDILREEWGFNGVVVTDWGGNNDRVQALIAGNELEMPTTCGETDREIVEAVKSGKIEESLLDECLERLLRLTFETHGALREGAAFDQDKHHAAAQAAAEESIVLLKNDGGLLPLKEGAKVAVIGDFAAFPRYQGAGSSNVNPTRVDSALSCMDASGLKLIGFESGFKRYGKRSNSLIKKACKLAASADTVLLYIGLDEATETEGLDRKDMKLPGNQLKLIAELKKLGKKIVAVLSCGCALETDWDEGIDAVVYTCLSGQAGAMAALNVITGKINPSGKLAESFPIRYENCASAGNFPGIGSSAQYREGPYIGYRHYDSAGIPVKYPFGHGLSYTQFEYSGLEVSESGIRLTVTNTGTMAGAEVVQMYVGAEDGKVYRPKKELKGFAKVQLEPGERAVAEIPFDEYTFRYFNVKTGRFETEPCTYTLYAGASSVDIRLSASVKRAGSAVEIPYNSSLLPSYYSGSAGNVSKEEFEVLLGRQLPPSGREAAGKKRIQVDYITTVAELRRARGWTGRLFSRAISFAYVFLNAVGRRKSANVLMMGMFHLPMRGLSRMSGGMISWGQLDGLILMFNGRFFKGVRKFFQEKRKAKRTLVKGDSRPADKA